MGMGGQNIVGSQQAIRQQNPQVAGQIRQRQLADQQRYSQSPQPYAPVGLPMTQQLPGGVELQGRAGNNPYGSPTGGKGGGQAQVPPQMLGQLKDMLQKNQPQNPMVQHQQQQPNQMQLYQDMLRGQQNPAAGPSPYSAQFQQTPQAPQQQLQGLGALLGGAFR